MHCAALDWAWKLYPLHRASGESEFPYIAYKALCSVCCFGLLSRVPAISREVQELISSPSCPGMTTEKRSHPYQHTAQPQLGYCHWGAVGVARWLPRPPGDIYSISGIACFGGWGEDSGNYQHMIILSCLNYL